MKRLSAADYARLGSIGLRTRPLRVTLSALGIAIGIGAMLAVVGISASSHADLDRTLSRLGTNLLTVAPGMTLPGDAAQLPAEATAMVSRIGPVQAVAATGELTAHVYRNDHIPPGETSSIAVLAADRDLLGTLRASMAAGKWIAPDLPTVVLGWRAADRLDIRTPGRLVWLAGRWFTVTGLLAPVGLAPELDSAALVGWPFAMAFARFDGHPTRIYLRTPDAQGGAGAHGAGAYRQSRGAQRSGRVPPVRRPRRQTGHRYGADGPAGRTRRRGTARGRRRRGQHDGDFRSGAALRDRPAAALGATRGHIRSQFLAESLLLSGLGGIGGVILGIGVTVIYALARGWPSVLPAWATLGGLGATLLIGGLAGLYPALRASRVAPATALASA
jgi:putative ABC transport system permease protein